MARFLSRWLSRDKTDGARENVAAPDQTISDAKILRDHFSPSQSALSALADLVRIIVKPLDAATRERLVALVRDAEPGEDASSILHWTLTRDVNEPETIDPSGWCLCISVDWRASNEIEWQTNQMLDTLGIAERWTWSGAGDVPAGLLAFGEWLGHRGYALLHLDTGSDAYMAFAVGRGDLDEVLTLANAAGAAIERIESVAGKDRSALS
ncbi:hypothetical protein FAZ95_32065 [Trinickia violacea]|uniref:DUF6630 domain-containing protein n=1 Tax=Trinickia violacea TaxID=2571746 RepID=A0A4P8IYL7_9BURK|nr:hypothetical protein [Trinickia violacea]QCP53661.1 hypothetical protein FAZ95_32065 [Trinickia violacea]